MLRPRRLAGNLRDYTFVNRDGQTVKGSQVDYNGQPAGYAADPSETITYVDAHDNETLFDVLQYKLPQDTSMADRLRMNTVALSTTAFAQSPSFWHAGTDLLRSKSLDRNSYNSGDWFNRVDWSYQESTWGSGLPPAEDNQAKWDFMRPLLSDPALEPQEADIRAAQARANELLQIRFFSPLFRLGTAQLVQERVTFPTGGPNQTPAVIVMAIDDRAGRDLDPRSEGVVVVFNASDETARLAMAQLGFRAFSASRFEEEIGNGYGFAVVNFANPDMVGHTGSIPAVVEAVETVDGCLGRVAAVVEGLGGVCVVTADHGNAEQMLEEDGVSPFTAHTVNPVPLVVTIPGTQLAAGGSLADLVPTCLGLLGIPPARGMTGRELVTSL